MKLNILKTFSALVLLVLGLVGFSVPLGLIEVPPSGYAPVFFTDPSAPYPDLVAAGYIFRRASPGPGRSYARYTPIRLEGSRQIHLALGGAFTVGLPSLRGFLRLLVLVGVRIKGSHVSPETAVSGPPGFRRSTTDSCASRLRATDVDLHCPGLRGIPGRLLVRAIRPAP